MHVQKMSASAATDFAASPSLPRVKLCSSINCSPESPKVVERGSSYSRTAAQVVTELARAPHHRRAPADQLVVVVWSAGAPSCLAPMSTILTERQKDELYVARMQTPERAS